MVKFSRENCDESLHGYLVYLTFHLKLLCYISNYTLLILLH